MGTFEVPPRHAWGGVVGRGGGATSRRLGGVGHGAGRGKGGQGASDGETPDGRGTAPRVAVGRVAGRGCSGGSRWPRRQRCGGLGRGRWPPAPVSGTAARRTGEWVNGRGKGWGRCATVWGWAARAQHNARSENPQTTSAAVPPAAPSARGSTSSPSHPPALLPSACYPHCRQRSTGARAHRPAVGVHRSQPGASTRLVTGRGRRSGGAGGGGYGCWEVWREGGADGRSRVDLADVCWHGTTRTWPAPPAPPAPPTRTRSGGGGAGRRPAAALCPLRHPSRDRHPLHRSPPVPFAAAAAPLSVRLLPLATRAETGGRGAAPPRRVFL